MVNLNTIYMGLKLKNPIIAGASNLTRSVESIKRLEDAGAAAVVYKSLFEEQIQLESLQLKEISEEYDDRHAEMTDIFPTIEHAGPKEHLVALQKAKKAIKIPLIASLNAVNKNTWIEYVKKIEKTGVDAVELNMYYSPKETGMEPSLIENEQIEILKEIKKVLSIPVSVKLSYFYTNPLSIIYKMDQIGVDGFILFNRLFEPDIDILKEDYINPFNLSNREDSRLPLRFTAITYGNIKADICSSTGIYTGEDVLKMLLAGASCIQCVSTLFKNGIDQIGKMLVQIEKWMSSKGYSSIESFRGKLSKKILKDPFAFGRNQYVNILLNQEPIIKERNM
ncbi:MAG: dihydroorotate dehydrogenase-like protein [Actinobacteria bacterium]|nr:dihydroorotate dehydrogenase-like protein [Actinomycetota bacterium]